VAIEHLPQPLVESMVRASEARAGENAGRTPEQS
jgi:hypothetical protein